MTSSEVPAHPQPSQNQCRKQAGLEGEAGQHLSKVCFRASLCSEVSQPAPLGYLAPGQFLPCFQQKCWTFSAD